MELLVSFDIIIISNYSYNVKKSVFSTRFIFLGSPVDQTPYFFHSGAALILEMRGYNVSSSANFFLYLFWLLLHSCISHGIASVFEYIKTAPERYQYFKRMDIPVRS